MGGVIYGFVAQLVVLLAALLAVVRERRRPRRLRTSVAQPPALPLHPYRDMVPSRLASPPRQLEAHARLNLGDVAEFQGQRYQVISVVEGPIRWVYFRPLSERQDVVLLTSVYQVRE